MCRGTRRLYADKRNTAESYILPSCKRYPRVMQPPLGCYQNGSRALGAARNHQILAVPLPVIRQLRNPIVAVHADRIQRIVESLGVPIVKGRRPDEEVSRPFARLAALFPSVFGNLLADGGLDVVVFLLAVAFAAATDAGAAVPAKARFCIVVADGVFDVRVAVPAVEVAADGDTSLLELVHGGGSAFSWGCRDKEGSGCGNEKGGEMHLETCEYSDGWTSDEFEIEELNVEVSRVDSIKRPAVDST